MKKIIDRLIDAAIVTGGVLLLLIFAASAAIDVSKDHQRRVEARG